MRYSPLLLSSCLVLLVAAPSWAQSQRYATDEEIDALIEQHQSAMPELIETGFYRDYRSLAERHQLEYWANAWAEVDEAIAPFLGHWMAIEEDIAIFPAPVAGQVCIVDTHLDQSDFYLATVQDGKLYADNQSMFVPTGEYILTISTYDDVPTLYPYNSPVVSTSPASSEFFADFHPEVVRDFEAAGCLTGLPQAGDR